MLIARAPLRISLAGGGTDLDAYYLNYGGLVVSTAITCYCYAVARPLANGGIQLNSADYRYRETYPAGVLPSVAEPLALPKAAIEWFVNRGLLTGGIDLVLKSDVPPGTGLGSSSAMAVALIRVLAAYCEIDMTPKSIAEIACELEINRIGMPIGKQDQYASAFGGFNAIHFEPTGVHVEALDLPRDTLSEIGRRLLLFSTGTRHNSAEILRGQRDATSRKEPEVESALHQIKAIAVELHRALLAGQLDEVGWLLDQGWQQKKQLSNVISNPEIDRWYRVAREHGASGGKIVGAGGGGYLLLYCLPNRRDSVVQALQRHGLHEMCFGLEIAGARDVSQIPSAEPLLDDAIELSPQMQQESVVHVS